MRECKFRAWKLGYGMTDMFCVHASGRMISFMTNRNHEWEEINKITIMQYTGLKDKNGQMIYEGDIVSNGIDKGVIFWHDTRTMFAVDSSVTDIAPMDDWDMFEVIGNIYEHPELVKKQEATK